MDGMQLFWLFIMVIALQPVMRQRLLAVARKKAIRAIERARGSRVILLVHRQETMSVLGFPLMRYIDVDDAENIIEAIDGIEDDAAVDLVLHTPGGLVLASYQIARALSRHKGKTTVFVPHHALSGGTLIAMAADEIVMSEHAVLGPVDPQLGKYPAASLLKVLRSKPVEHIDDETLILADTAEKAVLQLRAMVEELLAGKVSKETADRLAETLTEGRWTHDFPITAEQAKRLGLPVSTEIPRSFLELMRLYPQPVRRTPSVESGEEPVPDKLPGKR